MIKIGHLIDERYRVISFLGEGGMAEVYEGFDIINKRRVAVKLMHEQLASDENFKNRFRNEASASAKLAHPNIVNVINLGSHLGRPYIINEIIVGATLQELLDARRRFTYIEAIDAMIQLGKAVSFAHQNKIIHCDIKPTNIFLTTDGVIKLGDFGVAKINLSPVDGIIVGSAHYLAPEVAQGKEATYASDIYSLGVTLFELVTGRLPFDGETNEDIALKHIKERFPSPKKYIANMPKAVEKIIMRACKKRPRNRYKSVDLFVKDLENIKENPDLLKPHVNFFVRFFGFATEEEN